MVDGSGLENRHTRKGIRGSNPFLSAIHSRSADTSLRTFRLFLNRTVGLVNCRVRISAGSGVGIRN